MRNRTDASYEITILVKEPQVAVTIWGVVFLTQRFGWLVLAVYLLLVGSCAVIEWKRHLAWKRDALLEATNAEGIMTRPAWNLMHRLPMYQDCPRMDLSVAESLEKRIVNIPSSASRTCP